MIIIIGWLSCNNNNNNLGGVSCNNNKNNNSLGGVSCNNNNDNIDKNNNNNNNNKVGKMFRHPQDVCQLGKRVTESHCLP